MGNEFERSTYMQESHRQDLARRAKQEVGDIIGALPMIDRRVDKKTPKEKRASDNLSYLNNTLGQAESLQEYLRQTDRSIRLATTINVDDPSLVVLIPGALIDDHTLPFVSHVDYDRKGVVISPFIGVGYRKREKLTHGDLNMYFGTDDARVAGMLGLNKFANMSKESLLKRIQKGIK